MRFVALLLLVALVGAAGGCPGEASQNPFVTYTEEYGITGQQADQESDSSSGAKVDAPFRRSMQVTLTNHHPDAELNTTFVAWVRLNSIRSAEQVDALLRDGYTQLDREVQLGTAYTLPIGTFVYGGAGAAGGTAIFLQPAATDPDDENAPAVPSTRTLTLITPDVLLVYSQPPVSCESVAFYYSSDGLPLTGIPVQSGISIYAGSTGTGGFKTLAQVNVYDCTPLQPGLFFSSGGAREENEYLEGEEVAFDFYAFPNASGDFGIVTIGTTAQTTTTGGDVQPGGEGDTGGG
ncbi:MAG: hypothetical protein AB1716_12895 [Planctomycetota bacterium]